MSKFKIGDRVRDIYVHASAIGTNAGTIISRDPSEESWRVAWDGTTTYKDCWADHQLELIEKGPVRDVTRKELVEGQYGVVHLDLHKGQRVVYVAAEDGWNISPSDLRAAAATFIAIAEALEVNK